MELSRNMDIKFPKNTGKQMVESLMSYFEESMDEELTDLKAKLLLDFFFREIGPSVYNLAVSDVQSVMIEKVNDLEGSCYQQEFGYWKK